ncbi:SpoIIE family protein phosphatase [Haliovirga abyssi]|uniref:HAMP domain-containing protein n=1 Tax=Haliovirga abyssi TaxID=2996794 RepID=A0AAU9D9Z3_9FUSO|nr:SpoIIE family protein phosphatase [Haliovirga abyssi]BDU50140.1 hypothetical protein HLVA_07090 [Haliovirga abyssi]
MDLKKISIKNIVVIIVGIIYFVISYFMFTNIRNNYYKVLKSKFIDENKYSEKSAKEYVEKEKERLLTGARIIASDEQTYHAFKNNIYLKNKYVIFPKKIEIKTTKFTKYWQIKLANFQKNKLYGTGRGSEPIGVAFYSVTYKLMGNSSDFERKFIDNGNEKYIKDVIALKNLGGVGNTLIQKKENEFYIKALAPIGKDSRYFYSSPYGIVAVGERLNGDFLEKLKKAINREVILFNNNLIYSSTLFYDTNRYQNIRKNLEKTKENGESVVTILGKKYIIDCFPIYNYDKVVIGYIGVLDDFEVLNKLNLENKKLFLKIEIITFIILIMIIYFVLTSALRPLNKIIEVLHNIKEGNYKRRISNKGSFGEYRELVKGINEITNAVDIRENSLKKLNRELENRVMKRTKELNNKNYELAKAIVELRKKSRKINDEMEIAKKLHKEMSNFEKPNLKCINFLYKNYSVNGIGGDFIEILSIDENRYGVFFGDIAGHGVSAALMISALKFVIRTYFREYSSPKEALYSLNDIINKNFVDGITLSCSYFIFNKKNSEVLGSFASQEKVYIIGKDRIENIKNDAIILGVLSSSEIKERENLRFEDKKINLKLGEKLFLYTDGLVENGYIDRDDLEEKLRLLKKRSGNEILEKFDEEIKEILSFGIKDDTTILIIEKEC